jgi:hypothetical protein
LFDFVPANSKAKSTLLQRRAAAQASASGFKVPPEVMSFASASSSPVFSLNVPPEVMSFFGKSQASALPATTATSLVSAAPIDSNGPLYPSNLKPAHPYLLNDFCKTYHLSLDVLARFTEQGFTALNQLCYISLSDLRGMAFKPGEIASIQDAIAVWTASL